MGLCAGHAAAGAAPFGESAAPCGIWLAHDGVCLVWERVGGGSRQDWGSSCVQVMLLQVLRHSEKVRHPVAYGLHMTVCVWCGR
jgi:hypothetical protein